MTRSADMAAPAAGESKGYLVYDPELCTGCQTCELACSAFKNGGKAQPSLSRIQVPRYPFSDTVYNFEPKVCFQCQDPKCMAACVEGAMYVDEKTGARCIDESKCMGCKLCIDACAEYYGLARIVFDPVKKKAFKCDLCGGDPQCVKWCSNGALKYGSLDEVRKLGYVQDFYEPYLKDYGPTYAPKQAHKITFEKAYPYLARKK